MTNMDDDMTKLMDEFYNIKDSPFTNHENLDTIKKCLNDNCNSNNFILEDCNYICTQCGTLQDRFIDDGAEWRFYGHNDSKTSDPTRCGMATNDLFPEFSLGSVIAYEYGKNNTDMRNLCKYQKWNSTTYKERALYNTVEHIYTQANNSGIPQTIIDEAKTLYKSLSEQTLHRGLSRSGIIASCLYWSCKKNKVPRSAKEVSKMFNIDITTLTKGSKIFHNTLKINVESTNAKDFIIRFCSNLNLDQYVVDLCIRIVEITEEIGVVSENSPPSIASGIIYLACNICDINISKKQIAQINTISEVTINKTYKKLYKHRSIILPSDIIYKYSVK
jgi:transcription initiation factor TFIIB